MSEVERGALEIAKAFSGSIVFDKKEGMDTALALLEELIMNFNQPPEASVKRGRKTKDVIAEWRSFSAEFVESGGFVEDLTLKAIWVARYWNHKWIGIYLVGGITILAGQYSLHLLPVASTALQSKIPVVISLNNAMFRSLVLTRYNPKWKD
jgi:hypothetical protein